MERVELAEAAAVVGALAAPLLLLARSRVHLFAGLALLTIAEVGLAFALVPSQLELIARSPARLGAALLGLAGLAGLAVLFVRLPAAIPIALLAAAPIRVPVQLAGEEAFLLMPLYAVLGAAAVAVAVRLARGVELRQLPVLIAAPVSAFVFLAGVSLLWSGDPRQGTIQLFFFLFPFAALLAVVAQIVLSGAITRVLAGVLLVETALVAAIGLWQRGTRDLFFADDIELSNAYTSFFRVTSIFNDSSVYGRYLVLGIATLLALLWLERVRLAVGLPLLALLLAGLYFSYSQSSYVALSAAVLVIGSLAGDRLTRRALAVTAAAVVLAGVGLFAAVTEEEPVRRVTSGRIPLASLTLPVFFDHPVAGVGIGAQPWASTRLEDARRRESQNTSHTTPLTVAAELGVLGLVAYAAFLFGAFRGAFLARRRDEALGLVLIAALTILFVHALFYSGFFEDPFTWLALGLSAACLAAAPAARREEAPFRSEAGVLPTSPPPPRPG